MKFNVPNPSNQPPEQVVDITLRLEDYHGCKLPTLYANSIAVLHILDDGTIVVRDKNTTRLDMLEMMGFLTTTAKLHVINASEL